MFPKITEEYKSNGDCFESTTFTVNVTDCTRDQTNSEILTLFVAVLQ